MWRRCAILRRSTRWRRRRWSGHWEKCRASCAATAIRKGGTAATLRGIEFYDFGAFFSRAYRENDYLWGRLHGCERMVDMVLSTSDHPVSFDERRDILRRAFLAIIEEEREAERCAGGLLNALAVEIEAKLMA